MFTINTHRFLFAAFFFVLASSLFFMRLASFSIAQANDAEIEPAKVINKHFKVVSTYTGIDWLQQKPVLLPKKNVILIIDKNRNLERTKNNLRDSSKDFYTVDAIDISNINNPVFLKTLVKTAFREKIFDIVVTDDEKQLLVAYGGAIEVYDISNISNVILKDTIRLHGSFSLALSADSKLLYVSGCLKKKSCSNISVFKLTPSLEFVSEIETIQDYRIAVSKDNSKMAFFSNDPSRVVFGKISPSFKFTQLGYDAKTYNTRMTFRSPASVGEMTFSADGDTLYVSGGQGGVITYDVSDNGLDKIQQTAGRNWGALFNNTGHIISLDRVGDTLYIAGSTRKKVSDTPRIKNTKKTFRFSGSNIKASPEKNLVMVYTSTPPEPKSGVITFLQPIKEEHRIQEINN